MFAVLIICASLATIIATPNRSDTGPEISFSENEQERQVVASDFVQEMVESNDGNPAKAIVLDLNVPKEAETMDSGTVKESVDETKNLLLLSALPSLPQLPSRLQMRPTLTQSFFINQNAHIDHVIVNSTFNNNFNNSSVTSSSDN